MALDAWLNVHPGHPDDDSTAAVDATVRTDIPGYTQLNQYVELLGVASRVHQHSVWVFLSHSRTQRRTLFVPCALLWMTPDRYVFEAACPFLVGFFHSSYHRNSASATAITPIAEGLFARIMRLERVCCAGTPRLSSRHADALINCIIHMHDPEGSLRCTGVSGGCTEEEVRLCLGCHWFRPKLHSVGRLCH